MSVQLEDGQGHVHVFRAQEMPVSIDLWPYPKGVGDQTTRCALAKFQLP
jgi:hypothetical protein